MLVTQENQVFNSIVFSVLVYMMDHYCPVDFIAESIGCRMAGFLLSVRHLQPVDPT